MINLSHREHNYISYISKYIDTLINKKRRPKYTTEYYMEHIYYVLKTGIQWNNLICASHYTTIYKKFIKWNTENIFNKVYSELLTKYIHDTDITSTYIDSTHIKNINGKDCIGLNHYDRFRKSTASTASYG